MCVTHIRNVFLKKENGAHRAVGQNRWWTAAAGTRSGATAGGGGGGLQQGSACSSGSSADSAVLTAMGIPGPERQSGLRLTLGPWLSDQDLDAVPGRFASALTALS